MANQRDQTTKPPSVGGTEAPVTSTGNGKDSTETAKDAALSILEQARATAGDTYGTVAEKTRSTLEQKRAGLADNLTSVAKTLRRVGDDLDKENTENVLSDPSARYARAAAGKIDQAAQYIEKKDIRAMGRDMEGFARNNAAIFLGAAFAAGILAARLLKSSPDKTVEIEAGSKGSKHQLPPGTNGRDKGFETAQGAT